ncbi:Rieske (2Fe-2S) protein [Parahaliea aestuarii]|uniref:Rieske (2Fe-2S) protein n=1 Tax=Parahaliea aestuarii TaxID=1852021 RepID=A0A5C8ZUF2_9GAMM|nr:Rieske (2Fe-2S) protein [Parahaliea aestuarii]TXS91087.1 Rieske (2Fe-2S) protein [Parahaliea aestuarii]
MRFFPLEKLINLHDHYTRRFKIDSVELLLIQRAGERYLIEARCPHRDHPLDAATIADGIIQCALHQYQFAIADGQLIHATEEPCRGLRTFELVYDGNEVGVMLNDGE